MSKRLLLAAMAVVVASAGSADDRRRSSYQDMAPTTRTMQDDDTANPGMLWVLDGEVLWTKPAGDAARACADCHGKVAERMRGVAARYPVFDPVSGGPVTLEGRINWCRTTQQKTTALAYESSELLALAALVAHKSRGLPIAERDPRLKPIIEAGRTLFRLRQGQLNLSCAICHDDHAGGRLAGNVIPQAHPTGYPIYRLEWQTIGSLHRRLRNCLSGMRAENRPFGSADLVALETYLASRAQGMKMESPGVRP